MKLTIALKDEDRSQLLQLAAQDPDRGLAELVGKAIEAFLASRNHESTRKERVDTLRGCLSEGDVEEFAEAIATIRSGWR